MKNDVWKTDEQVKWEKVRDHAFSRTLKLFIAFLKTQDQLKTADDLVPGLTYTYMTSWNYVDNCRCILWDGILVKPDDDAQLNVEISIFGENICEVKIYGHKKGLPLSEGWHIREPINSEDIARELGKTMTIIKEDAHVKSDS